LKTFAIKKFIKSFDYAGRGIYQLVKREQNARIHLLATVFVIIAGVLIGLNRYEWMVICIVVGMVWSAEAFNTAVEKLVDMISAERCPQAGLVKDIAAGGVLICALAAFIIAMLVFVPHLSIFLNYLSDT